MENKFEAPIKFYGARFELPKRTDLEKIDTPQINFAEEIQIRLPSKKE